MIKLLLIIYAGFTHAFETDHLLAVSNIVSQRNSIWKSMKDGIFWGLGHTSTILIVAVLMLIVKVNINENTFHYLEATVGIMLIVLGIYRIFKLKKILKQPVIHSHEHLHPHIQTLQLSNMPVTITGVKNLHLLSYCVGLVHGLAGSGELVVMVMLQMKTALNGIIYLLIFGLGCLLGMLVAASAFSIPFYKKLLQARSLQIALIILSSVLSIGFGVYIVYKNMV
jgi:cytochrome c biogenesis protein CcdA